MAYWQGDPETWSLIERLQDRKTQYAMGHDPRSYNPNHSREYVLTNPVTGQPVSKEDLRYALKHLPEIYSSGMINEDRFAFLWYH
jgi:hypothetical protein